MEIPVLKLGTFEVMFIAVIAIYIGEFFRAKLPILKKYCLPAPVVGGTLVSIIILCCYYAKLFTPEFDYTTVNTLFYCWFFAASGASASMALLKKGGKLVIIFAVLAAALSALQNTVALGVGSLMGVDPLISMMTGSIPMTGGHGNAASFAPVAVEAGAKAAMEVALASATFGLISGSILGGPFGNFLVKKFKFEDPALDGKDDDSENTESVKVMLEKKNIITAVLLLCIACGIGQIIFLLIKARGKDFPIHVCCMFGGIMIRLWLDSKKGDHENLYEAIDTIGDFSLALFVSMSIVTMKLWQLAGLGPQVAVILISQVVLIVLFCFFLTFPLLGKNYDAAVMAVGHMGFGLGAVPVSMTTMQTVCKKYRYSKLAFFVVPVIGGFISNISNALIITQFLNLAAGMR